MIRSIQLQTQRALEPKCITALQYMRAPLRMLKGGENYDVETQVYSLTTLIPTTSRLVPQEKVFQLVPNKGKDLVHPKGYVFIS